MSNLSEFQFIKKNGHLGEGAFSQVHRAMEISTGKIFAMKEVDLKTLNDDDYLNLKREVKLHQNLSHPNIIQFHNFIIEKDKVFLQLELANNGTMFYYIHSREGLPENLAMRFFYQVASAVHYLHSKSLIHRDIKPENILFDSNFNIKLCDFGWSCLHDNPQFRTSICGTYEYMAPEIVINQKHTNKADIWCMGILLYEMLHGMPPYQASNLKEIQSQILGKSVKMRKSLSEETKSLLRGMLRGNQNKRLTAGEVMRHPAMVRQRQFVDQALNKQDFSILIRNYLLNTKGNKNLSTPEIIRNIQEKGTKENRTQLPKTISLNFKKKINPIVNNVKKTVIKPPIKLQQSTMFSSRQEISLIKKIQKRSLSRKKKRFNLFQDLNDLVKSAKKDPLRPQQILSQKRIISKNIPFRKNSQKKIISLFQFNCDCLQ